MFDKTFAIQATDKGLVSRLETELLHSSHQNITIKYPPFQSTVKSSEKMGNRYEQLVDRRSRIMWMKRRYSVSLAIMEKEVKAVKYHFYLSSGKIRMMMVMIKISNIGKTWGNGSPLVQPYCRSALQKFVNLKMHSPWEPSTPHVVPATETLAPVHRNTALYDLTKVHQLPKCLPVQQRLMKQWCVHGVGF